MNIYIALTLIGAVAKIWAITVLRKNWCDTLLHRALMSLCLVLLAQTTTELPNYLLADQAKSLGAYWVVVSYYVCAIVMIAHLPIIAILATERRLNLYLLITAIAATGAIVGLMLFTNLVISDVATIKHALTRVAGPYYTVFQIAALVSVLFSMFIYLHAAQQKRDIFIKVRSQNLLLAFIPTILFSFIIIFAMHLGYQINAIGMLPICILFYVAALIQNANPKTIPDYSVFVPFSKKWRLVRKLTRPFINIQRHGISADTSEYENTVVEYALDIFDGNKTHAANFLNTNTSWVKRRAKPG